MTAAKKKPAPAPKPEPVREEEPVRVQTKALEEEQEVAEIKRPVRRSEDVEVKRPVRNKPRRFVPEHEAGLESEFESDEEELSKGEKIALYVVGALLIAVIDVIVVILLKIKG